MLQIVDPDTNRAQHSKTLIELFGPVVTVASSLDDLRTVLKDHSIPQAAALVTYQVDAYDIDAVITRLREYNPLIHIFLLRIEHAEITLDKNIERKILGIVDYPLKFQDVLASIRQMDYATIVNQQKAKQGNTRASRKLIGISSAMHRVGKLIRQVALTHTTVLIRGESGTGKEVVARSIHSQSRVSGNLFVPVNCGAIPAELLESELFGHERGAFTGAISSRQGRFEMAQGGTLFLDEIGDMPLDMQVKLLRVLQERKFERIGSNKSITSDVRVIAATNQNLEKLIQKGDFRRDLFYRLNVFPITIPPLRKRPEDIPLMINELLTRFEQENGHRIQLASETIDCLCQNQWPGNVRELANLIERLGILYPDRVIGSDDLPEKYRLAQGLVTQHQDGANEERALSPQISAQIHMPDGGIDLRDHLNELEIDLIRDALNECDWVVARAAKMLNLQRTTLVEKIRKYSIVHGEGQ